MRAASASRAGLGRPRPGGALSAAPGADISDACARHARAVAQTLGWADEAAAGGDHAGALSWLRTLEMIGHELSDADEAKRQSWRLALGTGRGNEHRGGGHELPDPSGGAPHAPVPGYQTRSGASIRSAAMFAEVVSGAVSG